MDIHKPKPVHNWREFLGEIGIIVIGVLVALTAEQVVEAIHWHHQVAEAREAVSSEIAGRIIDGFYQVHASPCAEQRLDALTRILDDAVKTGQLPPVGDFRQPPLRVWPSGAWTSVLSSQTAAHFPRDELIGLAGMYDFVSRGSQMQGEQVNVWSDLHQLEGPGRPFTAAEAAPLRAAILRARMLDRSLTLVAVRLYGYAAAQKMAFSAADLRDIADARQGRNQDPIQVCLAPAAPTQGTVGALAGSKSIVDGAMSHLPPLTPAD